MRIAHFSDAHALSLEGVRPWAFFNKRIAGLINLRLRRQLKHPVRLFEEMIDDLNRHPPDEVVVTGDLTNLSLPPEFRLARSILDRIALGAEHVTVVPGNHDVYTLSAQRGHLFSEALSPYAHSDGQGEVHFPSVRVRGAVAIVGVCTARPSPPPLADGRIGLSQLAELGRVLAEQRGKFRILLLHHPPYTNHHFILRGLRDRKGLQRVLAEVGCELVLHGHEHRDVRRTLPGPDGEIPIVGVGSCTYDDPRADRRARYNVYHIESGRLDRVETRVHDPKSGRFEAAS